MVRHARLGAPGREATGIAAQIRGRPFACTPGAHATVHAELVHAAMRILHVAAFLQGTAGRAVVDLARAERQAGHDVDVVISRRGVSGRGHDEDQLHEMAEAGIAPRLIASTFQPSRAMNVAATAAIDRIYARGHEPHIIHAHAPIPGLVARRFTGTRRAAIGLVQTHHQSDATGACDRVAADVPLLNLMDHVAVRSRHCASRLERLGVDLSRVTHVPWGVPPHGAPIAEADHETWLAMTRARRAGRLVVACVRTSGDGKDQVLVVDAVARMTTRHVLVVFIGGGDAAPIEAAVRRRGCGDCVRLHGHSRSPRALAAGADVLVHPAGGDGRSNPILEAFADGLLVAANAAPEILELVEDGVSGLTFAPADAVSLAATVEKAARLSNSSRRAMRDAARARHAADFTRQRMVDRYTALYADVGLKARAARRTPPAA
jgi:glycosyltransferase involved in cell wall biosynthesis